jgi:hypothetical protein
LEATQLGRPKCYFPPAGGCVEVRLGRETMRDQQLNNRQMASLDGVVQDSVINRAAMRDREADAVVMTWTVSVQSIKELSKTCIVYRPGRYYANAFISQTPTSYPPYLMITQVGWHGDNGYVSYYRTAKLR